MVKIEIKEGKVQRFFLGRRLKRLSAMLALVAALSTATGKAHAHELDLSGYFNRATVNFLTGTIQKDDKDRYNTFMEKLTLARNIIKTVYENSNVDITQIKKTMNQINQLIDYFENMQEDYEELDLSDLLKDLNRIKEILVDNLVTSALTYTKKAKSEITADVLEAVNRSRSFGETKSRIIKNGNYATAVIILKISEDLGIENARLTEAKLDIIRINDIFATTDNTTMGAAAEQAFR